MSTKIQLRRDTASAWTSANPALAAGEIGYETDTRNIKIGDGTTLWNSLKYQAPYYTGTNSTLANGTLSVDQTNNRVGIGTTSPSTLLHVKGSYATGHVRIETTGDIGSGSPCYAGFYGTTGRGGYFGFGGSSNTLDMWNDAAGVTRFATNNTERMRIDSAGLVGIATTSPAGYLGVVGDVIIGNQATTGTTGTTRLVASAGINYIQSAQAATAGSAAPLVISAYGGGAEWMRVTSSGVTSSGLITANAGLTVPTGQALTVAGNGTVSVPAGSIAGAALADNGVTVAKLSQLAAGNFLGNSTGSTANVAAVTQAQARTMLGLVAPAYTAPVVDTTTWVDLALTATSTVTKNFDATTLPIGVPVVVAIRFARSSGNAQIDCNLVVESSETVVISCSDQATTTTSWTNPGSGNLNYCYWYKRNVAQLPDPDVPPVTVSGAQTYSVFTWRQSTGNSTNGPRCWVYMLRLS